jgi:hypothetical protein
MEFEKTSIDLFGLLIQEPVTALTDLLVTGVCLYAFLKLKTSNASVRLLRYYFLTMAIATAYGGIIGHAFMHYLEFGWKVPGWLMSMISVALLERAAITHAKPLLTEKQGNFFTWLNSIELVILTIIVLVTLNFKFVEAHAAYGLLVIVFSFEAYIFKMNRAESSVLFLVATGIAALAATVHLSQFSIHTWFNHLDLSHVLMAGSAYVFFLAGRKIEQDPLSGNVPITTKMESARLSEKAKKLTY